MCVDAQVVMMGAAKVGKSSLISQFLYGTFSDKYKRTVEEMHQVQINLKNKYLTLHNNCSCFKINKIL